MPRASPSVVAAVSARSARRRARRRRPGAAGWCRRSGAVSSRRVEALCSRRFRQSPSISSVLLMLAGAPTSNHRPWWTAPKQRPAAIARSQRSWSRRARPAARLRTGASTPSGLPVKTNGATPPGLRRPARRRRSCENRPAPCGNWRGQAGPAAAAHPSVASSQLEASRRSESTGPSIQRLSLVDDQEGSDVDQRQRAGPARRRSRAGARARRRRRSRCPRPGCRDALRARRRDNGR